MLQTLINILLYSYLLLYTRPFDIDKNYSDDKNVGTLTIYYEKLSIFRGMFLYTQFQPAERRR
ncbi:MAG: hypothetical protein RMY36_031790 [Nostoc sp. SerVER01]|nr:hypothetical protein [Nostoc sp. DedQUE11]MDZ8083551.1 hypothetical protein [Nostoc sp. DcaGUA01]